MAFAHLHTHSEYSLLDGANRIPELVRHVKKLGMDSLAVTDHGNLHAAWHFHAEARAQGLRGWEPGAMSSCRRCAGGTGFLPISSTSGAISCSRPAS